MLKNTYYLKDANDTPFVLLPFMYSVFIQMNKLTIFPWINGDFVYIALCWVCPGVRGEVRGY